MSKPTTALRVFYPDSNTVTALALYDATGATITPANVADGAGDPPGWKSKVVTLALAAEALFASATFAAPESPVSLYLTRDESGTYYKVLDESVFDTANPGRPTPAVTAAQEHLLYETLSQVNGGSVWTVKAPTAPVCTVKAKGKDPMTQQVLDGNDILFRWTGPVPTRIEVEADVEDIADARGFVPVPVENVTSYAESSVGLSLVKSLEQVVPHDGLGHATTFRLRYNVNGDPGAWVVLPPEFIVYDLPAPNAPQSVSATLLRDRDDQITDVVRIDWTPAATNPGTGFDIYATDYLGKKHKLVSVGASDTSARVENVSRFVVQDAGPAVSRPYLFSVQAVNISAKSEAVSAAAPVSITSKVKEAEPLSPDDIAGTARDVIYAVLKAETYADVIATMGTLPEQGQAIVSATIDALILKIKDVIAKGGSVELQDFGTLAAKWTTERIGRNPSNGDPVLIPSYRSLAFKASSGFKAGTKAGTLMTDAAADAAAKAA